MNKKYIAIGMIVIGVLGAVTAPFNGLWGNILVGILVAVIGVFWYRRIIEAPPKDAVYYIEGSQVYHYYDWDLDNSSKDLKIVSESKAKAKGLRPCKRCQQYKEQGY